MATKKSVKTTIISFLLDETGSMMPIKDDTIGGFNSYIESLQQDKKNGKVKFSLIKFDSNHTTKVHVGVPIEKVDKLNNNTYNPGASTPLIDAFYKIIKATEEVVTQEKDPQVLIVVQTDGHENASVEYTYDDVVQLVKEKTEAGWGFVFLGAGIDAFSQSQMFGLSVGQTLSYDRSRSDKTFETLSHNTQSYRSSGSAASLNFTPDQRVASGDAFHQPDPSAQPTQSTPAPQTQKRRPVVNTISLVEP